MKKLWLLIAANLLFTAACGGVKGIVPAGATTAEVKPKAGETVIYQFSREGYYEGTVESVEGARYKIKTGEATHAKDDSDVYALPKAGAKAGGLKAGDMVAAKMDSGSTYWSGAEVLSVSGDVVEVRDLFYGKTASVSPDKIVAVRPAAAAELQKVKAEKEFSARAQQAKPRPPAGYKPKAGDRVVARWSGNTWYDGEVVAVSGNKATIKWQSFKDSELPLESVVPYPTAETSARAMPAPNGYVLVKPESGSGHWNHAQVTAVDGGAADVKFASGKTRSIKADEYVALY